MTNEPPQGDDFRPAARAYLQRAETRISTFQRIGGAFLSGAGLLVLLPVLITNSFSHIIGAALSDDRNLLLLLPYGLSVFLPLYALLKLIEDLIRFYFSAVHHGDAAQIGLSRFSLSGLAFPPDESIGLKTAVIRLQNDEESFSGFAVGETKGAKAPLQEVWRLAGAEIVDPLRREYVVNTPEALTPAEYLHIAMGITGSRDRTLTEEVARAEASLARHALILRRLVLRYGKALLIAIWTTIVTTTVVGIIDAPTNGQVLGESDLLKVALSAYVVWGVGAIFAVRLPVWWSRGSSTRSSIRDPSLKHFERWASFIAVLTALSALIGLIVDIWVIR